MRLPFTLLLLAPLFSACMRPPSTASAISSAGTGQVTLTPTRARLFVAVTTHGATASLAAGQTDQRVQQIMAVLRADSAVDSLRIDQVEVSPHQNDAGKVIDFEATATIEVVVRHLDKTSQVMDGALRGGATSIGRIRFETDSTAAGRRQALGKAYANARDDAEALPAASGQRLGDLISVSASESGWQFGTNAFEEASVTTGASFGNAQSGIVTISPTPSNIIVSATVEVKWRIQPR